MAIDPPTTSRLLYDNHPAVVDSVATAVVVDGIVVAAVASHSYVHTERHTTAASRRGCTLPLNRLHRCMSSCQKRQ